ncbi:MAG: DUF3109 family protein [Bacteroidales bacterium]|jgi:hypothetical protein|nr:DUF3109 family protein [Bacteroidales bacterium]
MFEINNTLVSDEVFTEFFCCDLIRCEGCCCVEGDAGAPLEREELPLLEKYFPVFKKYMTVEGLLTVSSLGRLWDTQEAQISANADTICFNSAGSMGARWSNVGTGGNNEHLVTPIIKKRDCAYLYKDSAGISKCAIEKAWEQGEISFQKPVSCHLFPIRITAHENYDAVNYFQWHICQDAVKLGTSKKIPVFRFLKAPLIRKYGKDWYDQAEQIYSLLQG